MDTAQQREQVVAVGLAAGRFAAMLGILQGRSLETFSGVMLRFRGRFVVATARHCVEKVGRGNIKGLRLLPHGSLFAHDAPKVRRFIYPEDPAIDVALVELDPTFAQSLHCDWVDEHRLRSHGVRFGQPVLVHGYPWQLATIACEYPVGLRATPIVYSSVTVRPPDVRLTVDAAPIDPEVDFFLPFDRERLDGGKPLSTPHGMSGAGIWVVPEDRESEVWSPDCALLMGIQSSYIPRRRLMRAKRIDFILSLLEQSHAG